MLRALKGPFGGPTEESPEVLEDFLSGHVGIPPASPRGDAARVATGAEAKEIRKVAEQGARSTCLTAFHATVCNSHGAVTVRVLAYEQQTSTTMGSNSKA